MINKSGIIFEGLNNSGCYDLAFLEGETAFVVNDKSFSLTLEDSYPKKLMFGLIAAESDSNGMYGVFDLFTGEQLLGYEYEEVNAAAGYLYAYKNGTWDVFRVAGPEA